MVLKLKREMSELLLKEVEDIIPLVISQRILNEDMIELEVSDVDEVELLINDEIVYRGLDRQNIVNLLGKKLYELYDEVSYQKHNS